MTSFPVILLRRIFIIDRSKVGAVFALRGSGNLVVRWSPRDYNSRLVGGRYLKEILDDRADIFCGTMGDNSDLIFFFLQLNFGFILDKFVQFTNVPLDSQSKIL